MMFDMEHGITEKAKKTADKAKEAWSKFDEKHKVLRRGPRSPRGSVFLKRTETHTVASK